jgi:hypothetical protein
MEPKIPINPNQTIATASLFICIWFRPETALWPSSDPVPAQFGPCEASAAYKESGANSRRPLIPVWHLPVLPRAI